jgi:hypothetical protein
LVIVGSYWLSLEAIGYRWKLLAIVGSYLAIVGSYLAIVGSYLAIGGSYLVIGEAAKLSRNPARIKR